MKNLNEITSVQLLSDQDRTLPVVPFNEDMAICTTEGLVLVTKAAAMAFFSLSIQEALWEAYANGRTDECAEWLGH